MDQLINQASRELIKSIRNKTIIRDIIAREKKWNDRNTYFNNKYGIHKYKKFTKPINNLTGIKKIYTYTYIYMSGSHYNCHRSRFAMMKVLSSAITAFAT